MDSRPGCSSSKNLGSSSSNIEQVTKKTMKTRAKEHAPLTAAMAATTRFARLANQFTYWNSTEAKKLFYSEQDKDDPNTTVIKVLERRIQHLRKASLEDNGWRQMILGADKDNAMTSTQIRHTVQKSQLLCQAYIIALKEMNSIKWSDCCQKACEHLNPCGIEASTAGDTVTRWHQEFRSNNDRFNAPVSKKNKKPELFETFPEAEDMISDFCFENLAGLTMHMVHDYVTGELLEELFQLVNKDRRLDDHTPKDPNDPEYDMYRKDAQAGSSKVANEEKLQDNNMLNVLSGRDDGELKRSHLGWNILQQYKEKPPSFSTVYRWMHQMGWSYDPVKKVFKLTRARTLGETENTKDQHPSADKKKRKKRLHSSCPREEIKQNQTKIKKWASI